MLFFLVIPDVTYYSGSDGAAKSCLVTGYILDCLHKCMLHDTDNMFQKEVFNMLLKPLVDQVRLSTCTWLSLLLKLRFHLYVYVCVCIVSYQNRLEDMKCFPSCIYISVIHLDRY